MEKVPFVKEYADVSYAAKRAIFGALIVVLTGALVYGSGSYLSDSLRFSRKIHPRATKKIIIYPFAFKIQNIIDMFGNNICRFE